MAGPNPPAPIAMNNISVFKSANTGTIIITTRTWEDLTPTEVKTFVKQEDADYDHVLGLCQAKGLL
jgi:hypothetical protein